MALLPQPLWWWQSGSTIDALLTYYATTGDVQYEVLLQNTLLSQATGNNDFMTPDATGNDDQAWWGLAAMTAAENNLPIPAGAVPWLDLARNVFNEQKSRWAASTCGGGMRWKVLEGNGQDGWHYKNSITNGLFFQLAARLAKLTDDADAQAWAEKAYDWTVSVGLIDGNFNVYDGTDELKGCGDVNHDQWSYNVGVFMYGSAVMAARTGDAKWVDRTGSFIASAKRTFTNADTGALWEQKCDAAGSCDTDQVFFKGALARWLGATASVLPELMADVAGIIDAAATAVQNGATTGLGPIESFNALEVVDASLSAQGMGGVMGMIGLARSVFHAYAYGTAFWYGLRGLCRVYDPVMVVGWFRPPSQLNLAPNDLELYNVRNDGWCLITLALILISFTNAVPFSSAPATKLTSIPYAKAVVAATVFHHITTGIGAYQHYKVPSHYNTSMSIGVWGNVWLTLTGLFTWTLIQSGAGDRPVEEVTKKVR
ncbi:mannan endo-1,6-alpha-mannosidase DCW1 precursor [Clathrospora elynae]|uniref:mannan endo-1,6-alpha-mannosidase n=1 Tax=Clathrospora elynae TaxID=706981 RepID=A0A6A5SHA3_9PLEO|nr:mannan endo-1,6-alpha-mannosidase DCW1 precursor [Clathrospora elynae]